MRLICLAPVAPLIVASVSAAGVGTLTPIARDGDVARGSLIVGLSDSRPQVNDAGDVLFTTYPMLPASGPAGVFLHRSDAIEPVAVSGGPPGSLSPRRGHRWATLGNDGRTGLLASGGTSEVGSTYQIVDDGQSEVFLPPGEVHPNGQPIDYSGIERPLMNGRSDTAAFMFSEPDELYRTHQTLYIRRDGVTRPAAVAGQAAPRGGTIADIDGFDPHPFHPPAGRRLAEDGSTGLVAEVQVADGGIRRAALAASPDGLREFGRSGDLLAGRAIADFDVPRVGNGMAVMRATFESDDQNTTDHAIALHDGHDLRPLAITDNSDGTGNSWNADRVFTPQINEAGTVTFGRSGPDGHGIFLHEDGQTRQILSDRQRIAGGGEIFVGSYEALVGGPSPADPFLPPIAHWLGEGGHVVFVASGDITDGFLGDAMRQHLYLWDEHLGVLPVAHAGEDLGDHRLERINSFTPALLGGGGNLVAPDIEPNSSGQVAFGYRYYDSDAQEIVGGVALWTPPTPLAGDANFDGVVNLADFGILRANFGRVGPDAYFMDGDFNGDDVIDLADFGQLRANFGGSAAELAAIDGWRATVPEPGGVAMLAAAASLLSRRRRR
jgi:hypothetical protein